MGKLQAIENSFNMAYNKNELIQKIQSIEALSNEEKAALIELLRTHKKYGLVWEDKPEAVEDRLRSELPVLFEVKEKAIISKDPSSPNHILIEGDNLEVMKLLQESYLGKVKMIYIPILHSKYIKKRKTAMLF